MEFPGSIVNTLYTQGSLKNDNGKVFFSLKNRVADATVTRVTRVAFNGVEVPRAHIHLDPGDGQALSLDTIEATPVDFPLRRSLQFILSIPPLTDDTHRVEIHFTAEPFGNLVLAVDSQPAQEKEDENKIPRNSKDDYCESAIAARLAFLRKKSSSSLSHVSQYSFDPNTTKGNIENFIGAAQVPVGVAGPLLINGEHAQGYFFVPLATTEGTLVASYNRGMKVLNLCGGVKATVVDDAMQRAPAFGFDDARGARDFVAWCRAHEDTLRQEAEATSKIARLLRIEYYLTGKIAFLRFNYSTGDAAGQNMVGRATFAACNWIMQHHSGIRQHFLEGNMASDKKASQVNVMHTRGKRVVAECVLKRDVLMQHLRVRPEQFFDHYNYAMAGSILAGANNNGYHSANSVAAMFIATGQDVANVAESSTGITYMEWTEEKDLYWALTLPSVIVATYGGGTRLATQRECLEMLGCYGPNMVRRFAEVVAATAMAGEISLGAAVSALDWVVSHEELGRNR